MKKDYRTSHFMAFIYLDEEVRQKYMAINIVVAFRKLLEEEKKK